MIRMTAAQLKSMGMEVPGKPPARPRGMNRWESRFAAELEAWRLTGAIEWWGYESIKLRLAKKTWYSPDFAVWRDGGLWFYEVKGWMRDDAAVKLKVAAEQYPHFRFVLVRWVDKRWEYQEIGR